jgi:excisionase family DNA binding protein
MERREISTKELARAKGCTMKYVYDLLAAGRLRGARKRGKKWCIPVDAVAAVSAPACSAQTDIEGRQGEDGN